MGPYVSEMTKEARRLIELGYSVKYSCEAVGISRPTIYKSKWWEEFKLRKNDVFTLGEVK